MALARAPLEWRPVDALRERFERLVASGGEVAKAREVQLHGQSLAECHVVIDTTLAVGSRHVYCGRVEDRWHAHGRLPEYVGTQAHHCHKWPLRSLLVSADD